MSQPEPVAPTGASAVRSDAGPVLNLHRVRKEFGGLVAIENFTLNLFAGEIVALVGDNGAGKSTLVKMISGVLQPTSGTIAIDGEPVSFTDASAARRRRERVRFLVSLATMRSSHGPNGSPTRNRDR